MVDTGGKDLKKQVMHGTTPGLIGDVGLAVARLYFFSNLKRVAPLPRCSALRSRSGSSCVRACIVQSVCLSYKRQDHPFVKLAVILSASS